MTDLQVIAVYAARWAGSNWPSVAGIMLAIALAAWIMPSILRELRRATFRRQQVSRAEFTAIRHALEQEITALEVEAELRHIFKEIGL